MTPLTYIHNYYKDRIGELKKYSTFGDPWAFLMSASFIDNLVKMVYNLEPTNHLNYKDFIRDYLSLVNPLYRDFIFTNGNQDLPEQMYHVLRCGMVHSYSLKPDSLSIKNGGRAGSILLAHRKNGVVHFTKDDQNGYDSVILTAEDFTEDLEKVLDKIFLDLAVKSKSLEQNIIEWVTKYPPITAILRI